MKSKRPYFYGASLKTITRTKKLRRDGTNAEQLLWKVIRNRQVKGFKFRRQHTIYHFIVDFYCHEAKLIIELDGDIHELKDIKEYDAKREAILK
jgi:cyclase